MIAATAFAVGAPAASAQTREYEGTVVSVDRDSRTFRLRDSERGTVRVRVTSRTRFERINGFSGLRAGQTNIETIVRRSNGRGSRSRSSARAAVAATAAPTTTAKARPAGSP